MDAIGNQCLRMRNHTHGDLKRRKHHIQHDTDEGALARYRVLIRALRVARKRGHEIRDIGWDMEFYQTAPARHSSNTKFSI
jgi:hypothetical protein